MIDEIRAGTILYDMRVFDILSEFKCCWISFIETGKDDSLYMDLEFLRQFDHEDLNILFRSASHISSVTNNNISENIDKTTPFPSKPVRMPGCFTAAQKEIEVTEVDKIENLLNIRSGTFLGDNFIDRLIVLLSETKPNEIFIEKLKKRWSASEFVHCREEYEIDCISGSEFQSVLFIINAMGNCSEIKNSMTEVVSRAQYEVGIILFSSDPAELQIAKEELLSYLSLKNSNHVYMFEQFINSSIGSQTDDTLWLQPTNTNIFQWLWWNTRMSVHLIHDRTGTIECVNRQPTTVQLQLYFAFYDLFSRQRLPSKTHIYL